MQSQPEAYRYTPLDNSKDQIRLLSICPAKDESEPISCSLEVVNLADSLSYEALSYAWGDPARTHCIRLNKSCFKVTRSLGTALPCLRKTDATRTIWIDALCIDQENIAERNSQVLIMRDIYQQAWRVVVWLGNHDEPADHELFRRYGNLYSVDGDVERSCGNKFWELPPGASETTATANHCAEQSLNMERIYKLTPGTMTLSSDELPFPRSHLQCLGRIFARPYFTRLWILQEVFVAEVVVAMVGTTYLSWRGLMAASTILSQSVFLRDELHQAGSIEMICDNWKSPIVRKEPFNFLELLHNTSQFQASNKRDRIVALMGIANDCSDLGFLPDYSKTTHDFFMEFTKAYTKSYRSRNCRPIPYVSVENGLEFFPEDSIQLLRSERCICDGEEAQLILRSLLEESTGMMQLLKDRLAEK
jgi:hypothetical protein